MRSLIHRDPFNDLASFRDAMDRWFDPTALRPTWWPMPRGGVMIDMYETRDAIMVKATVPGAKPEDIDITVEGNTLTLKGEFKEETDVKKEDYYRQERWSGAFSRSVEIPTFVDTEKASATFENGVLTLTLPKKEEVKAKTIKVQPRTP